MLPCWWYTDWLSLLLLVFFTALRTLKTFSLSHSLYWYFNLIFNILLIFRAPPQHRDDWQSCFWRDNQVNVANDVDAEVGRERLYRRQNRCMCPPVRPPLITADTQIPTVLPDTLNLLNFHTLLEIFLVHRKLFPNNYKYLRINWISLG